MVRYRLLLCGLLLLIFPARALERPGIREAAAFGSRIVAGARHRDRAPPKRATR